MLFAKVFDLGETVHAAEYCGNGHEENFAKMVTSISSSSRVLDDFKSIKVFWKSSRVTC